MSFSCILKMSTSLLMLLKGDHPSKHFYHCSSFDQPLWNCYFPNQMNPFVLCLCVFSTRGTNLSVSFVPFVFILMSFFLLHFICSLFQPFFPWSLLWIWLRDFGHHIEWGLWMCQQILSNWVLWFESLLPKRNMIRKFMCRKSNSLQGCAILFPCTTISILLD
jgi:hypothetical protein